MRIVIDCSNYFADNRNNGDLAIFAVLYEALTRRCWPVAEGRVEVTFFTRDAEALASVTGPAVVLVPPPEDYVRLWAEEFEACGDCVPDLRIARDSGRESRRDGAADLLSRIRAGIPAGSDRETFDALLDPVSRCDLLILSGGGYFSDNFAAHATALLDRAETALRLGIPVVMLGCGFEPVTNEELIAKARRVLPALDLVACRERRFAPAFLAGLGVDPGRVHITGDYAISLARPDAERAQERTGNRLGLAVRCASYSGVADSELAIIAEGLQRFKASLDGERLLVQPVTISTWGPSDLECIRRVCRLAGLECLDAAPADGPQESPAAVIEALSHCRVVVSGSYHSAALGLAAGLPAVGIFRSPHYAWKLGGCLGLFGLEGMVDLEGPGAADRLATALQAAWAAAPHLKPGLLRAAGDLVAEQDRVWERIRELTIPIPAER